MMVGSLGPVVFSVSDAFVRTISGYSRKTSVRIESHDIIGQKTLSEWVGLSCDSISFTVKLSAFRGVNPKEEAEKLRRMAERGEAVTFVMGGAPVTQNKWLIESVDEDANYYDRMGNIISSDVKLSIREYAEVVVNLAGN